MEVMQAICPPPVVVGKPSEGGCHHTREAHTVGLHRFHLAVDVELTVLPSYSRTVEIEVHASKLRDELMEKLGGGSVGNVNLPVDRYVGC